MATVTVSEDLASSLRERVRGVVIHPGHPDYESARALYNAMIDKRPRAIARCVDAGDVIACVRFARGGLSP